MGRPGFSSLLKRASRLWHACVNYNNKYMSYGRSHQQTPDTGATMQD